MLVVRHARAQGEAREYPGVGCVFRAGAWQRITGLGLGQQGRIRTVGVDFAPRRLTLVTAYAPQSRADEEEREWTMDA